MSDGCPYKHASEIDFMDPIVQQNWFEAYDLIREESPAYFMEQIGMYIITRYDDIEHVLRRPLEFTSGSDVQNTEPLIKFEAANALYEKKGWRRFSPLSVNLPQHANYRALVDPALTASKIRDKEGFIKKAINELIDSWIDEPSVPFIERFAEPLPMIVIAELLGFPKMDLPLLKVWSTAWVLPHSRGLSQDQEIDAVEKHIELQHYIFDTMKQKRKQPGNDIITRLLNIEVKDADTNKSRPLTDTEIIGITDHLLIGGNETTTFALSNGLWLLFRNPETYRQLQQDQSRVKNFVEEVLRIESPTQGLFRSVKKDCELSGVKLPAGATLSIRYGAGNHDPRRFPDPVMPKLDRKNAGRHLAFGLGEKVCPGATLSRMEQKWAWEILFSRLSNIRPTPDTENYEHRSGMWVRALEEIYMSFDKII